MDWDFVSVSSVAEASSGNLTLNAPASAAKGDLLIACIGYRDSAAFTPPVGAGWNLVATQQSSGDTDATSGIASGGMWYLVRGVSNPSFAFTRTAGDVAEGFVLCYRNCTSTPYDTGGAGTLGSLGEPSLSAISTAEANELLVAMVVSGDQNVVDTFDAATAPSVASGTSADTTTEPTANTWVLRVKMSDNTGADIGVSLADGVKTASGSTGTLSAVDQTATTRSVFIVGAFKQLPTIQPSVYDSLTTDSVNQTIDIEKVTPSPNVFDAVGVEDELGTEVDNENLGPVSVNTEISADEFIQSVTLIADINVFDSITVTEESSHIFDLACNIYDEISTDESGTEVDNENLAGVNVYSETTVTDAPEGAIALKDIDTYDSISIAEDLEVAPDLVYSVYDEVVITESNPVSVSEIEKIIEDFEIFLSTSISPFDQITITEFVAGKIDAETSIFDVVTVNESITVENILSGINVSDLVGTDEYIITSVSGPAISVSDSISISESVSFEVPINALVFDTVSVSEDITSISDIAGINIFDNISVTDVTTLRLSDTEISVSDIITLAEDVNVVVEVVTVYYVDVYDSTSISENVVISNELCYTSTFDTITVSEDTNIIVEVVGELYTNVYDSVSVTEFITASVPSISTSVNDSVSIFEQVTLSVSDLIVNISDTLIITESIINAVSISDINVIDLITVTDVDSISIPFCQTSIFDSITVTEQVVSTVDIPGIIVFDSTSLEDTVTVAPEGAVVHINISGIFELVAVSEAVIESLSDLARQVYDSVSVSEYKSASINIADISVYDTVTLEESSVVSVSVPSSVIISGIYETVTVSELSTVSVPNLYANTYDIVSISESIEVAPDVVVSINDIVTVSEQILILNTVNVSIFDTSGVSESVNVILDYGINVSDIVNVSELVSGVGGDLERSVFDAISVSDWGYIYWLLAAGRLEVNCEGLEISVDTLGFMDRIDVDEIEIDIEALGI